MPEESLGKSLIQTAWSAGVGDIAAEAAELPLDSLLEEGPFKDLPFVGIVLKVVGVATAVKERLFLKKVAKFLSALRDIPQEKREQFREKLAVEPEFQARVGENLILLIDRHEHLQKALILGLVFGAYIDERISYEQFQRLASSIDKAYIGDLEHLADLYATIPALDEASAQSLYSAGLVRAEGYSETQYLRNDLGAMLINILRDENT